ncbi:DUF6529 family protein [Streptomyces sp. TLI_171]|uniref:DUF6529 family protein n=1 Tax=Streptomyces sp. TLI_171 TaxID=1938859 RepID=UPI000C4D8445|nr:DUF6529 family protein [Streptomyces sp. TLI_171]RKE18387.1 hypothetical protein BX266_1677 [Streptomyces sp. TLI_171]
MPRSRSAAPLLLAMLAPVAISLGLLWFGWEHLPDPGRSLFGASGEDALRLKSWLGSALFGLALAQLVLALAMYRGSGQPARRVRTWHRVGGWLAFALSLPIAQHCLLAYGVQFTGWRVGLHSTAGCFLYGAFAAKVLLVRHGRLPGWVLPVAGGALFCAIGVLWWTAALWFLNGYAVPGF